MKETIAQEAKRLLEPIPEEKWIEKLYYDPNKPGCHCFAGHWNVLHGKDSANIDEALRLNGYVSSFKPGITAFDVNDGYALSLYKQRTPKQRVMALLDDMIAAGL